MKRKQMMGKEFTCSSCKRTFIYTGQEGEIHFTTNPYAVEIHDDRTKDWYCDDCLYRMAEEI